MSTNDSLNNRTKNTVRNIIFGVINKIIVLLLPFIIRTIIIYKLSADYVGLGSLFSSILQVLSVTELGFASAITFSMYRPVSKGDTEEILLLIGFLKTIYKIVGIIILVIGLFLLPFLGYLVNGDIPPDINLYLLYLIYLTNTAISYFFFGYKNSILNVYQRNDITSKISSLVEMVKGIIQIAVLILFKNYYVYIIMLPIFTLISNLISKRVVDRIFPQFNVKTPYSLKKIKEMKKQIGGIAIGRISLVCRNSFDSIIISALFGLTTTAMYSNYYLIFSSLTSFLAVLLTSMTASVGNCMVTKSMEENEKNHLKFDFYFVLIASFCTICMFSLYQPFMEIWVGEDLMFGNDTMALFCIYFYINNLAQVRSIYSETAGIWWNFKWLSIIEMLANILLNIGLGIWIGVNGILLATIITAFFCSFIGITVVTYKVLFKNKSYEFFRLNSFYIIVTFCLCACAYLMQFIPLNGILGLVAKAAIASFGSSVMLLLIYLIFPQTRAYLKEIFFKIKKIIRREGL